MRNMPKSPELHIAETENRVDTRIILEFMRHGKRESGATPEEDANYDIRLKKLGREQSTKKGKELNPKVEVSLGWGSPRVRSQETAYRVMLANEDIGPDDTLEEIKEKVAGGLGGGKAKAKKKMIVDERLNFLDPGEVGKKGTAAYYANRYVSWAANESDQDALEARDMEASTYARMAGNVAEIVKRYLAVGKNFNKLAQKTNQYGDHLERYLGTHGGVSECFAAKVIKAVKGTEKQEEFFKAVPNAFVETEGIHIEILNHGDAQEILMQYKINGKEEEVRFGKETLDEIIKERKDFDAKVKKAGEK